MRGKMTKDVRRVLEDRSEGEEKRSGYEVGEEEEKEEWSGQVFITLEWKHSRPFCGIQICQSNGRIHPFLREHAFQEPKYA